MRVMSRVHDVTCSQHLPPELYVFEGVDSVIYGCKSLCACVCTFHRWKFTSVSFPLKRLSQMASRLIFEKFQQYWRPCNTKLLCSPNIVKSATGGQQPFIISTQLRMVVAICGARSTCVRPTGKSKIELDASLHQNTSESSLAKAVQSLWCSTTAVYIDSYLQIHRSTCPYIQM